MTAPLPPITGGRTAASWSWAIGAWNALPTMELATVTGRSFNMRLTGASSASFTLDGSTFEATQIRELVSDLWIARNGFTLARQRVGGSTHNADGTRHIIGYTAGDYRALLQRRLLYDADAVTYTTTEQSAIVWSLISSTQGKTGGDLKLANGSTPTPVSRTITYPAGQSIGAAIEAMSLLDPGFNWDILPSTGQIGQTVQIWQSRGENTGTVLDYPGRIASLSRTVDPGSYANAVRETGGSGLAAVRVESTDLATRPEGRWDLQLGDTSLLDAASIQARAVYDTTQRQQIVPTWSVKLYPGSWGGPLDVWLGDVIHLAVKSGPLNVDEFLRVFEIGVSLDDSDIETVTLTLSALDPFKAQRRRQYEFRLSQLERR